MSVEIQKKLAKHDVFFEHCYYNITSPQVFTLENLACQIRSTSVSLNLLSTDFGQTFNDFPVNGFRKYLEGLYEIGFSIDEIESMVKKNPKYLLGLTKS
ncbi:hypothetical protein ABK905_03715 [Acerihabitans sp. KWT182]|uniref:Uncharacterized protein n=1 Tax=Acerihabitans sp. KWT182 TaxID=3157919 RepID=A0AAU7QB24_9GAMM